MGRLQSFALSDDDYMRMAIIAAAQSPDPSTQNGAVLVTADGVVYPGWNRFARNLAVTDERLADRDVKMRLTVHAEETAIGAALRDGSDTEGATLYCIWAACTRCALAIVEAGVDKMVTLQSYYDMSPERWKPDIDLADEMLREAGVITYKLAETPEEVGGLRFNGTPLSKP